MVERWRVGGFSVKTIRRAGALLLALLMGPTARGQLVVDETGAPLVPNVSAAAAMNESGVFGKYVPRFGFRYDTGTSIGRYRGLNSFQGFLPIWESLSSQSLLFGDSRLLMLDDGFWGVNAGLAQRVYVPAWNRTIGGYAFFDNQNTGSSTYSQISGGVESLGQVIDARSNFYAPLGDSRKMTGEVFLPDGVGPNFVANQLVLGASRFRQFTTAMSGFDGEVGSRLFTLGGLDFRSFVGFYGFWGPDIDAAIGPRGRFEARLYDQLAMNLYVQNDSVFQTTVNFAVSMMFPRYSGRRWQAPSRGFVPVEDRLGEPIERIQQIVVARSTVADRVTTPALNPNTSDPYLFLHVTPNGNASGDGSIERPYGTLAQAFADSRYAAGHVVVYDHTSNVFNGNTTLAIDTLLLSTAPVEVIDTLNFGAVTLPGSGADPSLATAPVFNGVITVTGADRISGYQVNGQIRADQAFNIVILDNKITGTTPSQDNAAIYFGGLIGQQNFIARNTITTQDATNINGIQIVGVTGLVGTVVVTENTITNARQGVGALLGPNSGLTVVSNDISNTIGPAIQSTTPYFDGASAITITNNRITNAVTVADNAAIQILPIGPVQSTNNILINQNQISGTGGNVGDILVEANGALTVAQVLENTISAPIGTGSGIVYRQSGGLAALRANQNTITGRLQGVTVDVTGGQLGNVTANSQTIPTQIGGNLITKTGPLGTGVRVNFGAQAVGANAIDASFNQITGFQDGVNVTYAAVSSASSDFLLEQNTMTGGSSAGTGAQVTYAAGVLGTSHAVRLRGNTVSSFENGLQVDSNITSQAAGLSASVTQNTLTGAAGVGRGIRGQFTNGAGVFSSLNNTVTGFQNGIVVRNQGTTGTVDAQVRNNLLTGSGASGAGILGSFAGAGNRFIVDTNSTSGRQTGIRALNSAGDLVSNILNNVTSNNALTGLYIEGTGGRLSPDVRNNQLNGINLIEDGATRYEYVGTLPSGTTYHNDNTAVGNRNAVVTGNIIPVTSRTIVFPPP